MTTAARPTFDPAKGGTSRGEKSLSSLSKQYSARDLPGHLRLKIRYLFMIMHIIFVTLSCLFYRQSGQGTSGDLKHKDFRRELEEREGLAALEKDGKRPLDSASSSSKKPRLEYQSLSQLDADEQLDDGDEDDDDVLNSDSDDDSEDDTQALLAELSRIKKERAAEESAREEDRKVQENQIRMENILSGNPLLNAGKSTDFKVKRRWDDDVVFKNCAKGEHQNKKGFINDTLRSDFHKKFMEKYIK